MSVFSLIQENQNKWQAKYKGNYGDYNIKIVLDQNNKLTTYKCTCPSDFSPCKHINMVLEKIKVQFPFTNEMQSPNNADRELIKNLINGNSKDNFIDFLIEYAGLNDDFINSIKLKFFTEKQINKDININDVIRKGLLQVDFEDDDRYGYKEEYIELEIIDKWNEKAKNEIESNNLNGALEIAKALLEEYAIWRENENENLLDYISDEYETYSFNLFYTIIEKNAAFEDEIYLYLRLQFENENINYLFIDNDFLSFFGEFSKTTEQKTDFLQLQEIELKNTVDEHKKESILNRTINFHIRNNFPEKAFEILEKNIEIDNFRKQIINKFIVENNFVEAKKLIHDKLNHSPNYIDGWFSYLLKIAELENDLNEIRTYSFHFIKDRFDKINYRKYKSTFDANKWSSGYNILEKAYSSKNFFSNSLVDFWIEEKDIDKILAFLTIHKNIQYLETYHKHIDIKYPNETLELFTNSLNYYAKNNLGRDKYEYVASILRKMKSIKNGDIKVNEILAFYKIEYKKRPAMMEILNKLR
jgi:hypothetical protein